MIIKHITFEDSRHNSFYVFSSPNYSGVYYRNWDFIELQISQQFMALGSQKNSLSFSCYDNNEILLYSFLGWRTYDNKTD